MANYECKGRTNYFKLKDPEAEKAFVAWCKLYGFYKIEDTVQVGTLYGFITDGDGLPSNKRYPDDLCPEEVNDEDEFSLVEELAPLLADGWVVVYKEIGWEDDRFYTGIMEAFDSTGNCYYCRFNEEIFNSVPAFHGKEITPCEY